MATEKPEKATQLFLIWQMAIYPKVVHVIYVIYFERAFTTMLVYNTKFCLITYTSAICIILFDWTDYFIDWLIDFFLEWSLADLSTD